MDLIPNTNWTIRSLLFEYNSCLFIYFLCPQIRNWLDKTQNWNLSSQEEIIIAHSYLISILRYLEGEEIAVQAFSRKDVFYSVQGLKIFLEGRWKKFIFIYFLPTSMFTFTSWVSYLIPPTSYPARYLLKSLIKYSRIMQIDHGVNSHKMLLQDSFISDSFSVSNWPLYFCNKRYSKFWWGWVSMHKGNDIRKAGAY